MDNSASVLDRMDTPPLNHSSPTKLFQNVNSFLQTQTVYEKSTNSNLTTSYSRHVLLKDGTNTLGIITFSLMFGMVLGTMDKQAKGLIEAFRVIDNVIMTIVRGVMWVTPFGVASIISSKILNVEDVGALTRQLGLFALTVLVGVLIYQLVVLQLIYLAVKRKNPFPFYGGMMQATVTAFATASAAVALPITFRCLENMKVDVRIAKFVLPIGVTINKDGTALFVSVASIFIAQMNGISLGIDQLITVAITSTAVSIASATVPSAALAVMFIVLNSIGVPTTDIGLLFAVDWLVDRIRTTNNHLGDCYAAVVIEHFSQKELRLMDKVANEQEKVKASEIAEQS